MIALATRATTAAIMKAKDSFITLSFVPEKFDTPVMIVAGEDSIEIYTKPGTDALSIAHSVWGDGASGSARYACSPDNERPDLGNLTKVIIETERRFVNDAEALEREPINDCVYSHCNASWGNCSGCVGRDERDMPCPYFTGFAPLEYEREMAKYLRYKELKGASINV